MAKKRGKLEGEAVAAEFKRLSKSIDGVIDEALMLSGLIVERSAKRNTPVDTGRLRASITTRLGNNYVEVGTNVKYAPYVEFGTSKQSAQPYLTPAYTQNKKRIVQIIKEAVAKGVGL